MEFSQVLERAARLAIVLRPFPAGARDCLFRDTLDTLEIDLIEHPSLAAAHIAVSSGCRVGLLIIACEEDLQHLELCEPFLNIRKISWVGLIAEDLISRPQVLQLIGEHLFNFIRLPARHDHIDLTIRHAWGMAHARDAQRQADAHPRQRVEPDMVGKTIQMQCLFAQIKKVARADASVLVTGPSGTGKELVAQSIHRHSSRENAPFVAVNCGAIAPQLFQSELFGYEKGAFTGAQQRKIGRIESADGGTLFLDEIGDMPFDMQVNLLRFLQEKTIVRVGGNETLPLDVRVIAATHVDLAEAVRQGRFREDLYYRINVVGIALPRLAERVDDIEDIANYYFAKFSGAHNKSLRGFSKAAMDAMLRHSWPGNVRELVNRVQRAAVMAEGRFIQPEDLGFDRCTGAQIISLDAVRAAAERAMIERALAQARNRISTAATLLGISRVKLYRLMEKYHIRSGVHGAPSAASESGPMRSYESH